jgi:hypothetical protein
MSEGARPSTGVVAERSPRLWLRWPAIVVPILVLAVPLGGLVFAHYWSQRFSRVMTEFSALWNTTDAIQAYVGKHRQWPKDWETLAPSLASVDPMYANGDISFAREHVLVNFQLDVEKPQQPEDWYVHLKSGDIPGEERVANERLGGMVGNLKPRRAP